MRDVLFANYADWVLLNNQKGPNLSSVVSAEITPPVGPFGLDRGHIFKTHTDIIVWQIYYSDLCIIVVGKQKQDSAQMMYI